MTFSELIRDQIVFPTPQLAQLAGITPDEEINFFVELQRYVMPDDEPDTTITHFEDYVLLWDGAVELYDTGIIELHAYNFQLNVFRLVRFFDAQGITPSKKL